MYREVTVTTKKLPKGKADTEAACRRRNREESEWYMESVREKVEDTREES